jgi:hypothetical protein
MTKFASLAGLLLIAAALPLQGQEQPQQPQYAYEAYYRIAGADMGAWNQSFETYAAPIMASLQEEGIIQGWSLWQHQTGGTYNSRFTIRFFDWASIGTFWDEYFRRLGETAPQEAIAETTAMIRAHMDEIWTFGEIHVPAGLEAQYFYISSYQVPFSDMAEWNGLWTAAAGPIMDAAMEEGILGGWVIFNHDTGGHHNFKVGYLFEDWDHMDDFFEKIQSELAEQHPAEWQRFGELFVSHRDDVWTPSN